jgi:TPR repeat protein
MSDASHTLALTYHSEKDYKKAIPLYEESIIKGNDESMWKLAHMYYHGIGIDINKSKAVELYQRSIIKGNINAMYNLAEIYVLEKKYHDAIRLYSLAIKNGCDKSIIKLGKMYQNGYGVEIDYMKTIELFKKGISLGNIIGITSLAYMYHTGKGVTKDYLQAQKLYLKAIEKGEIYAINNMASMYKHGQGVRQDYRKAFELFQEAYDRGDTIYASSNLATMYYCGIGVHKSKEKAIELYETSVKYGSISAAKKLAYIMTRNNPQRAITLFKLTYGRDNADNTINNIALIYKEINPVLKDECIDYFISMQKEAMLKNIYGYDDFVISTLRENYVLKKNYEKLLNQMKDVVIDEMPKLRSSKKIRRFS